MNLKNLNPVLNKTPSLLMASISRKEFIEKSMLGLSATVATPNILISSEKSAQKQDRKSWLIKNVRLETGFLYHEEGYVEFTETDLFTIEIMDGVITQIRPNDPNAVGMDAKGLLMLPSFKDMHIHLDKTYYGNKWKAVAPRKGGVKGMIALEQKILPEIIKTSTYTAEKTIELLQSKGTGFARSQANIETTSKLQLLENLFKALKNKKESFGAELVAFPQHGLYYTPSAPLMKEAAQMPIDFIGGLDPYSIDGSIEKPIDFTVQLALDYDKGIDIHLHETAESGLKTIQYLIEKVNENPTLKGRTYLSHCFILGVLDQKTLEETAESLAAAGIGINSTVPFGNLIMPIPLLMKKGVKVMTGNDCIVDHWNTFGTGSVLQKANTAAQLYGQVTEFGLSRMLKLATAGPLPLDDQGNQQWPKPDDTADFVLIDASCSAEAVSRISEVIHLFHKGNKVF